MKVSNAWNEVFSRILLSIEFQLTQQAKSIGTRLTFSDFNIITIKLYVTNVNHG